MKKYHWRDVHDVKRSGGRTVVHFRDGTTKKFNEKYPGRRASLTPGQRRCASKFIAEEIRTGKYPRYQAVAIGMSRARRECK